MMPLVQKIFFYSISLIILLIIINLVRLKKLKENYSLLWIFIAFTLILTIVFYPFFVNISNFLVVTPSTMLIFCGIVGVLMLILQLSISNSIQTRRIKNLTQKISILEQKILEKK